MNGYASDITRTYAYDSGSDFAALIEAMDLVAAGAGSWWWYRQESSGPTCTVPFKSR